jgi:hypothetical protein
MSRVIASCCLLAVLLLAGCGTAQDSQWQAGLADPTSAPSEPVTSPSAEPASSPSPSDSPSPAGPQRGNGTFTLAAGGAPVVGTAGTLRTYVVEVEAGITAFTVDGFAAKVDEILAERRSWTAGGLWRLQRVSSGVTPNFRVRLATPATVDKICGQGGMQTNGIFSCRTGSFVMINLTRWTSGTPDYRNDMDAYRHMVVNHEVGHFLGHGHSVCPGQGKIAPVMMQQTKGLNGCLANSFPYPDGVRYVR